MQIKTVLIGTIILMIIALSAIVKVQHDQNVALREEKGQLLKVANDSGRVARTYINLHGQQVSKNNVLELSLRNAQDLRNTSEFAHLAQFDNLNKKLKNLESATKIKAVAEIDKTVGVTDVNVDEWLKENRKTLLSSDSMFTGTTGKAFLYSDEFNNISGLIVHGTPIDSAIVTVKIIVPIAGVVYWQRPHKFIFKSWRYGKKEYFSEFTSENKSVTITSHETIQIKKRK